MDLWLIVSIVLFTIVVIISVIYLIFLNKWSASVNTINVQQINREQTDIVNEQVSSKKM